MKPALPIVPDFAAGPDGVPRFGAYSGVIADSSLSNLAAHFARRGLSRIKTEKRWHYACISGPDWIASLAIIRMGYGSASFFYLFDRNQKLFLVDETSMGPPVLGANIADRPGEHANSTYRMPGFHASILHPAGTNRFQVRVRLSGNRTPLDLALELDSSQAPPGVTAICPISGEGSVNLTVKQVALPAKGRIVLDQTTIAIDTKYYGVLDFTHGFLDRQTNWMWACAGGRDQSGSQLGLNLVKGFNGPLENVVWIGDRIVPVGEVNFTRGTEGPNAPWQLSSADGKLDLTFTPEGVRTDEQNLGIISSSYVQPVGTFQGVIPSGRGRKVKVKQLVGVTEEHSSRW